MFRAGTNSRAWIASGASAVKMQPVQRVVVVMADELVNSLYSSGL